MLLDAWDCGVGDIPAGRKWTGSGGWQWASGLGMQMKRTVLNYSNSSTGKKATEEGRVASDSIDLSDSINCSKILPWICSESTLNLLKIYSEILPWICSESALNLLWICSETALNLPLICSEIALKLVWNCTESALNLPWICSEIALKLVWNCTEIALKQHWNSSETALKPLRSVRDSYVKLNCVWRLDWIGNRMMMRFDGCHPQWPGTGAVGGRLGGGWDVPSR